MKTILTILAVLAFAMAAQAQTVVLEYDMSKNPDQQGFLVGGTCSTMWNATGTMLEYRGCEDNSYAYWRYLFGNAPTGRVDMRMRILDSDAYAFEVSLGGDGWYGFSWHLTAADLNNDTEWHDLTFWSEFQTGEHKAYIDGAPADGISGAGFSPHRFSIGDTGRAGMWGNVDISMLTVTAGAEEPVADEPANWGSVKSLYR
jgi:hypothetical protein